MKNLVVFAAGAIVGFGAGWFGYKTLKAKKDNKELNDIRDYYSEKLKEMEKVEDNSNSPSLDEVMEQFEEKAAEDDKKELENTVERLNYNKVIKREGQPDIRMIDSRIITPEDYFNDDDLDGEPLRKAIIIYLSGEEGHPVFLDGDTDKEVDAFAVISELSLEHIGEFEANTVYVRNCEKMVDYQLIEDPRTYEEYMMEEYGNIPE